ncbi:AlpA family transcriptional regulator [Microbacterium sp. VKM Ac-2923]|uniref:helix-turn-helix transcriptional regulator n=1 Tax=Microbacterium sp. VKM Ac-2923 TaxID=2929476 RepID=UPI001FB2DD57|nr:helix-turn-helix domain-containing protein [Microbacterium sp. VKM Ac-2923]MCJ1708724.1 helix-turn-helix domain-containing protein [Microbacterium sp. VKM Ac-2923]
MSIIEAAADEAPLPEVATRKQVALYTQTSVPTLARWAGEGKGPRFVHLGAAVRYRRADVLAWLDSLDAGGSAT